MSFRSSALEEAKIQMRRTDPDATIPVDYLLFTVHKRWRLLTQYRFCHLLVIILLGLEIFYFVPLLLSLWGIWRLVAPYLGQILRLAIRDNNAFRFLDGPKPGRELILVCSDCNVSFEEF